MLAVEKQEEANSRLGRHAMRLINMAHHTTLHWGVVLQRVQQLQVFMLIPNGLSYGVQLTQMYQRRYSWTLGV